MNRAEGTVSGGSGYDTISLDTSSGWGDVNLAAGTVKVYFDGTFSLRTHVDVTVSGIEEVIGSEEADGFFGSFRNETLIGREGDDGLSGAGGDDLLFGGAGADWLVGGKGDDRLHGGLGDDRLEGGIGNDTVDYSLSCLLYTSPSPRDLSTSRMPSSA